MAATEVLFADSDFFIALIKHDDTNHKKAVKLFETLRAKTFRLVTSNFVFSECVTVLSQRVSRDAALQFVDSMSRLNAPFPMLWVDKEVHGEAMQVFRNQDSKNVSFVDCANIALARRNGIKVFASFDRVYLKNGFSLAGTQGA